MVYGGTVFWGWGGHSSKYNKNRIKSQIKKVGGMIGRELMDVDNVYDALLRKKLDSVWNDENHPLNNHLQNNQIPRSGRLRMRTFGTQTRNPLSFIPRTMRLYNCKLKDNTS